MPEGNINQEPQIDNLSSLEMSTVKTYNDLRFLQSWPSEHKQTIHCERNLTILGKYLPLQSSILEIGSGSGRDAKLISQLYEYRGMDIAKHFLDIAKENNPSLPFDVGSVYTMPYLANSFDAFWASAMLFHIPKNRIDEALQQIKIVTKPNGIGFISIKRGKGEGIIEKERYGTIDKRYFSFYEEDEFKEILKRNNFEVLEVSYRDDDGVSWYDFFVKNIK